MSDDTSARVKLRETKILSDQYYTLRLASFDFQRRDGAWQHQRRESYDIGDAAAVLPLDRAHGTVLLIKQFRWPVFEWGYKQLLIEVIAGKLDGDTPPDCIKKEAMEEAGVTLANPRLVTHCFVSPGAVKERVSLFLADYDSTAARAKGGGHEHEGEDIEVLELLLDDALAMIAHGEIVDMKTVLLLQAAKLGR
ncbi:MAG TPA: NUDIX domain-containing protein [Rhizomicrobium sp.]|jgi:nudix-type nucleoside diphosphatase (YffH/AdpP family)|nr:NUDIX domain-containing protein [Rhizomicrobium sp.]